MATCASVIPAEQPLAGARSAGPPAPVTRLLQAWHRVVSSYLLREIGMASNKPRSKKPSPTPRPVPDRTPGDVTRVRRTPTATSKSRPAGDQPGTPAAATEHVRVRAYYLYLQRGGRSHDPLADWLQAERELSLQLSGRD